MLEQWSKSGESEERFAARIGVKPATLAQGAAALSPRVGAGEDAPAGNDGIRSFTVARE
jgi:hypothetical protein